MDKFFDVSIVCIGYLSFLQALLKLYFLPKLFHFQISRIQNINVNISSFFWSILEKTLWDVIELNNPDYLGRFAICSP